MHFYNYKIKQKSILIQINVRIITGCDAKSNRSLQEQGIGIKVREVRKQMGDKSRTRAGKNVPLRKNKVKKLSILPYFE